MIDTDTTDVVIEHYKDFLGMFVVIERENDKKAIGILKSITPDGKLYVQGDYMMWIIDPKVITDFSARKDRKQSRGGGR